jgi:carbonic anhydrase
MLIACSEDRPPTNYGARPAAGGMVVHSNMSNLVVHTDLNCLVSLQFAVEVLEVTEVIVCGHYGCRGVLAALRGDRLGLADQWLLSVRSVYEAHKPEVDRFETEARRSDRLAELNVAQQVLNLCGTSVIQDAWASGQQLSVRGWIHDGRRGSVRTVGHPVIGPNDLIPVDAHTGTRSAHSVTGV